MRPSCSQDRRGILSAVERDPQASAEPGCARDACTVSAFFESFTGGASVKDFVDWFPGVTSSGSGPSSITRHGARHPRIGVPLGTSLGAHSLCALAVLDHLGTPARLQRLRLRRARHLSRAGGGRARHAGPRSRSDGCRRRSSPSSFESRAIGPDSAPHRRTANVNAPKQEPGWERSAREVVCASAATRACGGATPTRPGRGRRARGCTAREREPDSETIRTEGDRVSQVLERRAVGGRDGERRQGVQEARSRGSVVGEGVRGREDPEVHRGRIVVPDQLDQRCRPGRRPRRGAGPLRCCPTTRIDPFAEVGFAATRARDIEVAAGVVGRVRSLEAAIETERHDARSQRCGSDPP